MENKGKWQFRWAWSQILKNSLAHVRPVALLELGITLDSVGQVSWQYLGDIWRQHPHQKVNIGWKAERDFTFNCLVCLCCFRSTVEETALPLSKNIITGSYEAVCIFLEETIGVRLAGIMKGNEMSKNQHPTSPVLFVHLIAPTICTDTPYSNWITKATRRQGWSHRLNPEMMSGRSSDGPIG